MWDWAIRAALVLDTAAFGSKAGDWLYNEADILRLLVYAPVDDAALPSFMTL